MPSPESDPDTYFPLMKVKRFLMKRALPTGLHRYLPRVATTNDLGGSMGAIHTLDLMLARTSQHGLDRYMRVGESARDNIAETLALCGTTFSQIKSVLDLPCGHGRVLRWLRYEMGSSQITACEIDRAAVDFCRATFGCDGVYSSDDLNQVTFPRSYDLIWVGSLFTHLDPGRCVALLRKLSASLSPGGVLVFTTHGEGCFSNPGLGAYGKKFEPLRKRMKDEFQREGYTYEPYDESGYYGITLHAPAYIKSLMTKEFQESMELVRFKARGWVDHQDVWSYRKQLLAA